MILKRRQLSVALGLLLVAEFSFFNVGRVGAIMYGDPVVNPPIQFPEVVSIWLDEDYAEEDFAEPEFICTGVLVAQDIVVTAAHCIQGQEGEHLVEVGATRLGNGRKIPVDATWYNPRYSDLRIANDVGVLHLESSANVNRLATISRSIPKKITKPLTLVGWGTDQNKDLRETLNSIRIKRDDVLAKQVFGREFNPRTTIAAGRYFPRDRVYGGACGGDSGGPLYLGSGQSVPLVIGITSYGVRGCDLNAPTVFARSDFYARAIDQGIAEVKAAAISSNLGRPAIYTTGLSTILGVPSIGSELTCDKGRWTPNSSSFDVRWYRSIVENPTTLIDYAGSGDRYTPNKLDGGSYLLCVVKATNSYSSRSSTYWSKSVFIAPQATTSSSVISSTTTSLPRTASTTPFPTQTTVAAFPSVSTTTSTPQSGSSFSASISVTRPYSLLPYWRANIAASSPGKVTKWCFLVDGRPVTYSEVDYGGDNFPFSPDLSGCFSSNFIYPNLNTGWVQFDFLSLSSGAHLLSAVVTDSLGAVVTTNAQSFTR